MARKLKEIKNFFKGIFAAASSSNIDDEAASYSVNVDAISNDGKLKGAPKDKTFKTRGGIYSVNTDNAVTLKNEKGGVDLVFQDFDSDRIEVIKDLYSKTEHEVPHNSFKMGDNLSTELLSYGGNTRVGYGKAIPPKFLGKQVSGGIQKSVSSRYLVDSAYCKPPKALSGFDKIYTGIIQTETNSVVGPDNSKTSQVFWGIKFGDKSIYRISVEHPGQTFDGAYEGGNYDSTGATEQQTESGQSQFFHVQSYGMSTFADLGSSIASFCPANHPDFTGDNRTAENDWFWVLLNNGTIALLNFGSGITNSYGTKGGSVLNYFVNDGTSTNNWPGKTTILHENDAADLPAPYFQNHSNSEFGYDFDARRKPKHTPPESARLGDILQTYDAQTGKGYVWINYYKPFNTPWDSNERFLFNCSLDTLLSAEVTNNKRFENKSFLIRRVAREGRTFRAGGFTNNRSEIYYRPYPNNTENLSEHQHWAFDGNNCSNTIKSGNWRTARQNRNYGGGYGSSAQWHFAEYYHGFKSKDDGSKSGGFAFTGTFGFYIPRLALIEAPESGLDSEDEASLDSGWSTDIGVSGKTEVEDGYKNIVGIITWTDSMLVNVATAQAYRVPGSSTYQSHQYRRLLGPYGYEDWNQNSVWEIILAIFMIVVGVFLIWAGGVGMFLFYGIMQSSFTTAVLLTIAGAVMVADALGSGRVWRVVELLFRGWVNGNPWRMSKTQSGHYLKAYDYLSNEIFSLPGMAFQDELETHLTQVSQLWYHNGFVFEYGEINQAIAWIKPKRRGHLPNQPFYIKRGDTADEDRELTQDEFFNEIDLAGSSGGLYLWQDGGEEATYNETLPLEPSQHDVRFSCISGINTGFLDFKLKTARMFGDTLFMSGYSGSDETMSSKETLYFSVDITKTNIDLDKMVFAYKGSWYWDSLGIDTSDWDNTFAKVGKDASRQPYKAWDGKPNRMLKSVIASTLSAMKVSETKTERGFIEVPSIGAAVFCLGDAPLFNASADIRDNISTGRFFNLDSANMKGTLYSISTEGRFNYICSPFEKLDTLQIDIENDSGVTESHDFMEVIDIDFDCCNSIHKQIGTLTINDVGTGSTAYVKATLGNGREHYLTDGDVVQVTSAGSTDGTNGYFSSTYCYTANDIAYPGCSEVEIIDGENFKCLDFQTGLAEETAVTWKRVVPGTADADTGLGGRGGNATRLIDLNDISYSIRPDTTKEAADTGLYFNSNFQYRYKISFVYDGVQNSPLSQSSIEWDDDDWTVLDNDATYGDLFDASNDTLCTSKMYITIKVSNIEQLSKRITGVNLWRVEHAGGSILDETDTANSYYLVKTIPFDSGEWSLSSVNNNYGQLSIGNNTIESNPYSNVYATTVTDTGLSGNTFKNESGFSQVIKSTAVNYKLSTQIMDMMFVADIAIPDINDLNLSGAILRSVPGKLDSFDYILDSGNILLLPNTPTAMISFKGNLYAWDLHTMYKIDPMGPTILDTWEGTGCIGNHAVERTESGIMFADDNHIYIYDGEKVVNLGIPLASKGEDGIGVEVTKDELSNTNIPYITWKSRLKNHPAYIKFEPTRRSFCVFFRASAVTENVLSMGVDVTTQFLEIIDNYDSYEDGLAAAQLEYPDAIQLDLTDDDTDEVTPLWIIPSDPNFDLELLSQDLYKEGVWEQDVCFMFNIDRKRWDIVFLDEVKGVFYGGNGEILFSGTTTDNDFFDLEALGLVSLYDDEGNLLPNAGNPFISAKNFINISSESNATDKLLFSTIDNAKSFLDSKLRRINLAGDITFSSPDILITKDSDLLEHDYEYIWEDLHVWANFKRSIDGITPTWWVPNNDGGYTEHSLSSNNNSSLINTQVQNNWNTNLNPSFEIDYSQTAIITSNGINLENIKSEIDNWYNNDGLITYNVSTSSFQNGVNDSEDTVPDSIIMYNSYPGFEDIWTIYGQNNFSLAKDMSEYDNSYKTIFDTYYSEIGTGAHFPLYSKAFYSAHNALYLSQDKDNYYNRAMPSTSPFLFHANERHLIGRPKVSLSFIWGYLRSKMLSDEDIDTYIYHNTIGIDSELDTIWKTGHQAEYDWQYNLEPFMSAGGHHLSYTESSEYFGLGWDDYIILTSLSSANYNNYISGNKYLGTGYDSLKNLGHWAAGFNDDPGQNPDYAQKRQYPYNQAQSKIGYNITSEWYIGGYELDFENDYNWLFFADGYSFNKYIPTGNYTTEVNGWLNLGESSNLFSSTDYLLNPQSNSSNYDDFLITLRLEAPESISSSTSASNNFESFWLDKIKSWWENVAYIEQDSSENFIDITGAPITNANAELLFAGTTTPKWETFWKIRNLAESSGWIEKLPFVRVSNDTATPDKYRLASNWVLTHYKQNEDNLLHYSINLEKGVFNNDYYTEIKEENTELTVSLEHINIDNFEEGDTLFFELEVSLFEMDEDGIYKLKAPNVFAGSGGKMLSNLPNNLSLSYSSDNIDDSLFPGVIKNNKVYFDYWMAEMESIHLDYILAYEEDFIDVTPNNNNPNTEIWKDYIGTELSLGLDVTKLLPYKTNSDTISSFDSRLANNILQETGSQSFFNGLNNKFSFNCNSDIQMGMLSSFGEWYFHAKKIHNPESEYLSNTWWPENIGKIALERRNWDSISRGSSNSVTNVYDPTNANGLNQWSFLSSSSMANDLYSTKRRVDNVHTKGEWTLKQLFDKDIHFIEDIEITVNDAKFGDGYGEGHIDEDANQLVPIVPSYYFGDGNSSFFNSSYNPKLLKGGLFASNLIEYSDAYLDRFENKRGKRQLALLHCMRAYNMWTDWGAVNNHNDSFDMTHPKYAEGKNSPESLNILNRISSQDFIAGTYTSPHISLSDTGLSRSVASEEIDNTWEQLLANPNDINQIEGGIFNSLIEAEFNVNKDAYHLYEQNDENGRALLSLVDIVRGGYALHNTESDNSIYNNSDWMDTHERIFWFRQNNVGKFYFNRNFRSILDSTNTWEEVPSGSEQSYSPYYDDNCRYSLIKLPLRSHNFGKHNTLKTYDRGILNTVDKGTSGWEASVYADVGTDAETNYIGSYHLDTRMKMHRFNPIHFMPNWEPNSAENATGTVFTSNELIKPYYTGDVENSPSSNDNKVTMGIGMTAKDSNRPYHSLVVGYDNNILNLYDERKLVFGSKNNGFINVDTNNFFWANQENLEKGNYVRLPLKFDAYSVSMDNQFTFFFNSNDKKQFLMTAINYFGGIKELKEIRISTIDLDEDGQEFNDDTDIVLVLKHSLTKRTSYISESNRAKTGDGSFTNYSNLDRRGYQTNPCIAPDALDSSKYSIYYDIWAEVKGNFEYNNKKDVELSAGDLDNRFRLVFNNPYITGSKVYVESNGVIYNEDGSIFIQPNQDFNGLPVNSIVQMSYQYELDSTGFYGDGFEDSMYGELNPVYWLPESALDDRPTYEHLKFSELLIPSKLNEEGMQIGNDSTLDWEESPQDAGITSGILTYAEIMENGPVIKTYKRLPSSVSIIREELSIGSESDYAITNKYNKAMDLSGIRVRQAAKDNDGNKHHDSYEPNYLLEDIAGDSSKCNFFAHIYSGFNRDLIYNSFEGIDRNWTFFTEWIPKYNYIPDTKLNFEHWRHLSMDIWVNNPVIRPYSRKINNWKLDFSVKENGLFGTNYKPERLFHKGALWNNVGDTLTSSNVLNDNIQSVTDGSYQDIHGITDSQNVVVPHFLDSPNSNYEDYTNGTGQDSSGLYYSFISGEDDAAGEAPHSDNLYERYLLKDIMDEQQAGPDRWGYSQMKSFNGGDSYEIVTQISIKLPMTPGFAGRDNGAFVAPNGFVVNAGYGTDSNASYSDMYAWVPYIPLSIKPSSFNGDRYWYHATHQNDYPWSSYFTRLDDTYNLNHAFINNHRVNQSQWNLAQNLEIEGYGITHRKARRLAQGYIGFTRACIETDSPYGGTYSEALLGDGNQEGIAGTFSANPYLFSLTNLYSEFVTTSDDGIQIDLNSLLSWINQDQELLTGFGIEEITSDMIKIEVVPVLSSTGFNNDGATQTQGSMEHGEDGIYNFNWHNSNGLEIFTLNNREGHITNPENASLSRVFKNSHNITRTFFGGEIDIKIIQADTDDMVLKHNDNNYLEFPTFEKTYPSKDAYFRPEFTMEPKHLFSQNLNTFDESTYDIKHSSEDQNYVAEGLPWSPEHSLYRNNSFSSKGFMFNWSRVPVNYGVMLNSNEYENLLTENVSSLNDINTQVLKQWFTTSTLWVPLKPAGVKIMKTSSNNEDTFASFTQFEERDDYLNRVLGFPSAPVSVNINTSLNNEFNQVDNLHQFSPIVGEVLEYNGDTWNIHNFEIENSFEMLIRLTLSTDIDSDNIIGTNNLIGTFFNIPEIEYVGRVYKIYSCKVLNSNDDYVMYELRCLVYTNEVNNDVELPAQFFNNGNLYYLHHNIGGEDRVAQLEKVPTVEEQSLHVENSRTDILFSLDFPVDIVTASEESPNRQIQFGNIPVNTQVGIETLWKDIYVQDWDYTNFDSSIQGYHLAKVSEVNPGDSFTSELDSYGNYYDVVTLGINPSTGSIWDPAIGPNAITLEPPTYVLTDISFLSALDNNYVLQEFLGDSARPRPWEWHSKNFGMDEESQLKSFIRVKITYYNTKPVVYAMFDNDKNWIILDSWDANNDYVSIPKEFRKAKTIKIKITSASNNWATSSNQGFHDTEVDSISIVYREREMAS